MKPTEAPWDLVIAGAGFSGLVAGIVAAEAGMRTLILETAAAPGGSAAISAGIIWAPAPDALARYVPDGDPALQRAYCDTFLERLARRCGAHPAAGRA
jgi:3-oxosteroid 1-dehydrogenase